MHRILPLGALLVWSAAAAQAQQTEPPLSPAPAPSDSLCLLPVVEYSPAGGTVRFADQTNPATTIQPSLTRVAGVQVTPYSGAPGAWATVRIRGVANLTGNSQPLYVIDGVPVYNNDVKPEQWSNMAGALEPLNNAATPRTPGANPLASLPVEDVASVEVLKGAAATALYGMQGTNGVIRITTKRGGGSADEPQPLRVRYAGYGGLQQVRRRYELLNARQFAEVANAAWANAGGGGAPPYNEATLQQRGDVNWQDRLLRVAGVQSHHLSLDGHQGGTRYYVAADYLQQAGVVINSSLSRYNLRLNLEQQLVRKLTLDLKVAATQLDQRQPGPDNDAGQVLRTALLSAPLNEEPSPYGFSYFNPEQRATEFYRTPRTRRLLTQLGATYQLLPGLALHARGGYERVYVRESNHTPDIRYPGGVVQRSSELSKTFADSWVAEAGARYQRTFGAGHQLSASLTYLRQEFQSRLRNDQQRYAISGPGIGFGSSYFELRQKHLPFHSPSAAASFTYGGRYEVQASMRADMAKAGSNSQTIWFPGGQLSWHLAKEAFLADQTALSTLTLRAGAGRTSSFFTPDRTRQLDAGLLVGVLQNRVTLDVQVYQRRTEHAQAILPVIVPSPGGLGVLYITPEATLRNRGVELTLNGMWRAGALTGNSSLAASLNQNQLEELTYRNQSLVYQGLEEGHSIARFFAYEQEGIYPAGTPAAGTLRYRDVNNDGQRNYADARSQGTGLPRYALSFYQQLRHKRLELHAQVDGLFGYQVFNSTLQALDLPNGYTNNSVRALNYWTPTRQDTNVPAPLQGNYISPQYGRTPTDQDLASGNHLRLSQLTVSYDVVNTAARQLSVWVGGQNLLVSGAYRGYDPNVSSGGASPMAAGLDASVYPVARVWQLGVRGRF
ncbi:TonB-dependent receptor [Hymenobacter coalescens]